MNTFLKHSILIALVVANGQSFAQTANEPSQNPPG